jgi:hypothetical protein
VAYRSGSGLFADAEYIMTQAPINVTARMRNNGSASQAGVTITAEIRDQFNAVVATNTKVVTVSSGESSDINFDFNFNPLTYGDMGQIAPAPFSTMSKNVTPVYSINVFTPIDENAANNSASKQVRFYLLRSPLRIANSVVNTTSNANDVLTPVNDRIGRLNNDSLSKALSYVGMGATSYDLFDRNGWEPRAVNYGMYRTMFWAGDTNRLTRLQRTDVRTFLAAGIATAKKSLVVASQEILGKHIGLDAVNDEQFTRNVLRATNAATGAVKSAPSGDRTPRAAGYDAMTVKGLTLALGISETVSKTTNLYDGTTLPMPSLMKVYSDAQTNGLARGAYYYVTRDAGVVDSMMGIASNSLNYSVVFLGVDWRHLPRNSVNTGSERVVRSIVEFLERSGNIVVPVELAEFNAQRAEANVNVNWATASEKNASHFEVERALISEKGTSTYASVGSVAAQGNSTTKRDYAFTDGNVSKSNTWSYRLKMVDLDGSSRYSNEVLIAADVDASTISVTPNPAIERTDITIEVNLKGTGMAEVTLVDLTGRTLRTIASGEMIGQQTFNLSTEELASGIYTVAVRQNGMVTSQTLRIVK